MTISRLRTTSSLVASFALAVPALAQKLDTQTSVRLAEFYSSPAWHEFLANANGQWRVEWCAATGTPKAIWGSGLPLADWRGNSLVEARRHANLLLQQQAALLGLGTSEFREVIGSRMSRTWVFVFDQFFRGLPVIGGRADVRVHMVGRVPMFGATAFQIPADFNITPRFDADTALAIAWQTLGTPTGVPQPAPVAAPRLVIDGDVEASDLQTFALAWEVPISNVAMDGSGPIGRYYVDALTGKVLRFVSDKHECGLAGCTVGKTLPIAAPVSLPAMANLGMPPVNTTVTVMGWTRTGVDANDPLVNTPMPGLVLSVPGIGNVTTDTNGQFTVNIAAAVSIAVGNLDGRHHATISGGSAPSGSFTVNPGVPTTIQLLTAGASTAQGAHTTTSYWTDRVNQWARTILGNSAELNTASNIAVTVNIASTCNAYYTGNSMNYYASGGGCANTSFSTVIAHEWGHGLDDRYGGISQTNGLSEGWGDILGCYLLDTPLLGSGFQTTGVALRNANNTTQYPCSGCGVHTAGQSWMGFAWKLRNRLETTLGTRAAAIALTEDIVVGSIAADATNQADAVLQVYIADDNDGNLANGTPNKVDLDWACNQHSLPIPGGGGGPGAPVNDECAAAIAVVNGLNGPYTTVGSTTSSAWPCAAGGNDIWFTYVAGTAGNLVVDTCGQATWDTAIQILSGSCGSLTSVICNDDTCSLQSSVTAAVTPGLYYIRVGGYNAATGSFSLNVNGPAGTPAVSTPFGTACGTSSKSFYELFTNTGFDLGGVGMRLVKNAGGFYVAQPGGTYVAPSLAATQLVLTDDSFQSVGLTGSFPYFGGVTTSLEVCSNGFVSPVTGNGAAYTPSAALWLGSVQPRWGTWHDFNPNAVGSGKVKFEQIGSIAYVTWDGVYSYNTTNANTFQMQFDLTTGNVTCVWQTMVASGNAWLVGYTAAGPNTDLGSMDISTALPGTFRTSADNAVPLALATSLPQLGATLTCTTTQFPASSVLGIQIVSTTRFDPGIDLSVIGMTGCFQFAGLDSLNLLLPVAQQAVYTMPIPSNPALMGLQLTVQSAAFVNGVNPAGLISSNGVALTLGV